MFAHIWVRILGIMFDEETMEFIKEREEKLGAPMLWRSYATWYAEKGRERREYGVFVYTDGEKGEEKVFKATVEDSSGNVWTEDFTFVIQ